MVTLYLYDPMFNNPLELHTDIIPRRGEEVIMTELFDGDKDLIVVVDRVDYVYDRTGKFMHIVINDPNRPKRIKGDNPAQRRPRGNG